MSSLGSFPPVLALVLASALGGCALIAERNDGSDRTDQVGKGPGGPGSTPPSSTSAPAPASCNADLATDPKNCGYCGHVCASCGAGLCPADLLAPSSAAGALVVDASQVFWTDPVAGDVRAVAKAGGGSVIHLASKDTIGKFDDGSGEPTAPTRLVPQALRLTGDRFFFLDVENQVVVGCPKSGCTADNVGWLGVASQTQATALAVSGPQVFWAESKGLDTRFTPSPGEHDPRSTGPGADNYDDQATADAVSIEVAEGATRSLFWTNANGVWGHELPPLGSLPLSAPFAPQKLSSTPANELAAVSGAVIAATNDGLARISTGPIQSLAAGKFVHVAADAAGVYGVLALADTASIVHVSTTGALDVLYRTAHVLGPIALDEAAVYFFVAAPGGVEIRRVAR